MTDSTVDLPGPDHRADVPRRSWWSRVKTFEPALLRGIVGAIVMALAFFGLDASVVGENAVEWWTYVFALLPMIQAWWTRTVVTPSATVVAKQTEAGTIVSGEAVA
jgi:hypothetical protein